jgi:calcineurin-like phosphoesterase family protein
MNNSRIFVTSDLHFFHNNIIKYCNRPYIDIDGSPDVPSMNIGIVDNFNSVVGPNDIVYILGDIAMGGKGKAPSLALFLREMNGTKYLVPGNHDTYILNSEECMAELTLLPAIHEIKIPHPSKVRKETLRIIMCHYPLHTWNNAGQVFTDEDGKIYHSSIHLHGHSHTPKEYLDSGTTRIDVGIDGNDGKPWLLNDLYDILSNRNYSIVDHHNEKTSHAY